MVPQVSVAKGGHYQVRLPEFDGSNISVAEWQRRVLAAKQANGWTDETVLQFLPASLTGSALVAYSSGRMASDSDLSSVLNAMSAQFQSPELSLREFYSLTWETGQSVDDYLSRLQQCLDTAKLSSLGHDTREELLIQKFISGLPREVQMAFEMQTSRLPLQQCVHLARRMVRKPLNPTYSERPLRTFQANSRRCFQCGQLGHIARDCSVNASSPRAYGQGNGSGLPRRGLGQSQKQGPNNQS